MSEPSSTSDNYLLGDTPQAIKRLLLLAQIYQPFTRRMLVEAGITRGMKVLDIGCGPGDVSLILADLVGSEGSVLGVDASAAMVQTAQARVQTAGHSQVSFMVADIRNLALEQQYDALVGRFILMHLPNPGTVLRQLVPSLRSGGIVAFQEYDLSSHEDAFYPPSELWELTWTLIVQPFQRGGGNIYAGMQLPSMFHAAGLPAPHLSYEAAIGADGAWPGFEMRAEDVRMFMPRIKELGLATEEEIAIDTLATRLRDETVHHGGVARLPVVVSAWVRIPQQHLTPHQSS